jgi:hypothetical protein
MALSALLVMGLGDAVAAPVPVASAAVHTQDLPASLPDGLSGMTRLPDGRLLAVSERGGNVVLLERDGGAVTVQSVVPITGLPEGLDIEAVTALPDDRVALGTEVRGTGAQGTEAAGRVLLARVASGGLVVEEGFDLSSAPFGIKPEQNAGLEAICAVPGLLIVVAETTGGSGRRRFAPAWLRPLGGGPGRTARLMLSSSKGKVAGLSCHASHDGVVTVTAVERHFSTIRLVRWALPPDGGDVRPSAVWDLAPALGANPPNLEGVVVDPDGTIHLVSDNDFGGVSGPAVLVQVDGLPSPTAPSQAGR